MVAFVYSLTPLFGQNPPSAPPDRARGQKIYAENCVGCHGVDFRGTDQGPALKGNPVMRRMSVRRLRGIISNGISGTGMPPFDLPAQDLEALTPFVRSLNSPAAESNVPGNPAAGEQIFFGKGECGSCHMASGRGQPIGPDLSNLGNDKTVDEIRLSLKDPSANITPGYELVTVKLRDRNTLRGFARSRSNFDIRVEDLQGKLHLLQEGQIASIVDETESVMPPVHATPEELQDLLAYLSRLTGVKPGALDTNPPPQGIDIDFERILHPRSGDWLTYNGTLNANRYSDLRQINTANVNKLDLEWIFAVPLWRNLLPDNAYFNENMKYFGLEVTPLVADGVMYITGPHSVFALDALTGREIWDYSRPRTPGLVGDASLGTNRGVAILGDKVFMVTDNAHLIALNRISGKLVWEQDMIDEPEHYGSTVAPLVVKDMVVAGVSGADWGMRGFLSAYKADTGERVWRFFTIPAKGEPGIESWQGPEPKLGGGSTWVTGSYDGETDILYWPTATPYPNTNGRDRPGDNLYTECILALTPETGKLKWHYQFTPHDVHVWDATEPPVLVDTRYRGQDRKLLIMANRNGFFYVLDRTNGQVLLAKPFINRLTWASGIGADGRPQLIPEGDVSCPETAANWNATAFSAKTRLFYTVAIEKCVAAAGSGNGKKILEEPGKKYIRALDIETGKVIWERDEIGNAEGKRDAGLLATAGGLIFYGDPGGDFEAMDERNGKTLWHFITSGENKASPMTYTVGSRQFVAVAVGPNILSFALPSGSPEK
ncbi:MAG: PQQ-binding-like beta-propeller repeat protein [Terriglobia bacterium]|jgi:PQQ-dependent dehydrogenase (methanol/ethanol family)